jgi:hypothetical protein
MGAITTRLRGLWDRLTKRRSGESGNAGERALKRQAAEAQKRQHYERTDKLPR